MPTASHAQITLPADSLAHLVSRVAALFFVGVGFFVWATHVYELRNALVIDDSFITYRYAANLAAGHGAVWNPGEAPIEGYSTPLYMLILAAGSFITDIENVSRALCIFSTLSMIGLTAWWVFLKCRSLLAASLAAGLLLAHPYVAVWAIGGMETPFYAALLILALVLAERFYTQPEDRRAALQLGLALAALGITRTEGVIFSFAFAASLWLAPHARRAGVRVLVVAFAIVGAHVIFRLAYYGLLLPAPAYQKGSEPLAGWRYVRDTVQSYWPFLAVCFGGAFVKAKHDSPRAAGVFGALAVLFLGAVIANTEPLMTPYHRYLFPLLPILFGFTAVSLCRISRRPNNRVLVAVFVSLVVLADGEAVLGARFGRVAHALSVQSAALRESHVGAARWIEENVRDDQVVALGDCGIIPYYSQAHVLDLFGLNDYHIARTWEDHHLSQEGVDYVFEEDPDFVVLTPLALDDLLEQDPRFRRRYRFLKVIRGFYNLGIYERRADI